MSAVGGPNVVKDCLTLYLDTPNERSYKGEPTVNNVPYPNFSPGRYNNTGFGGTITCVGQGTFKGSPVYLTTFIPTTTAQVGRLCSNDGFGFLHSMGCRLLPSTPYVASVYFCTNYPLVSTSSCGFDHGYSNISGWRECSTTSTRVEECGWTRLYTRYFRNTNGFIDRRTTLRVGCTINTNSAQTITFCSQIALGSLSDNGGVCAVVAHSPAVSFTDTLTGITLANHGLNETDWCKLSWPANPKFRTQLPYWYYVQLNVPSTGGVNRTICIEYRADSYYCSVTDSKYWKVRFNPIDGGAVCGSVICAWWAAPMLEQKSTVYPSNFVIGTRGATAETGGGWLDISGNSNNGEFINGPSFLPGNNGAVLFDGVNDYITLPNSVGYSTVVSAFAWFKSNGTPAGGYHIIFGGQELEISIPTSGELRVGVYTNARFVSNHGSGLTDGKWHYVGFTFNGVTKTAYIDGVLVGTQAVTGTLTSSFSNRTMGRFGSSDVYWLNGLLSNVQIYGISLSPTEVLQTYNSTKGRFGL